MKILITPYVKEDNKYLQIKQFYTNALMQRGALPILVPITTNTSILDRYLEDADGLLLSGGVDVDPQYYDEPKKETCNFTHTAQDETGMYLIKRAIEKKLPIFGICRGMQLLNVYFGGSLYQDLNTELTEIMEHNTELKDGELSHEVSIEKGTLLHDLIQHDTMQVNTYHHQAVKTLGKGLTVNAVATDGIIEAFEGPDGLLAVQWHPEVLQHHHAPHAKLFDYFVDLVKKRASA